MAEHFYDRMQNKAILTKCKRNISNANGKALTLIGECFIQLQIGKELFRDMAIVIQSLRHEYILGQVLCRA